MSVILLGAPLLPLAVAALAALPGCRGPRWARVVGRAGSVACAAGFVAAAVLLAAAVRSGPTTAVVAGTPDAPLLSWSVDRLAGVLLLLVFGISAVVLLFAVRYLAGDPRAWWFTAGAGLLTAASAGLVAAGTLLSFAICWTAAGLALCLLLATYPSMPGARVGIVRTAASFAIGDAALWCAVAITMVTWPAVDLGRLDSLDLAGHRAAAVTVAVLLVVAALARSAQVPFHRWLPATITTPTPVSALLHAGMVNAGGVLLTRLAPVVGVSGVAMHLAFVAGALTAAYATVAMLARPDVKGSLALSTAGQMGFMIMACGLGLYAAAVVHLVLHGCYKAALFLSSGSAVARARRHASAPPAPAPPAPAASRVGTAVGVGVPAVVLAATAAVVGDLLTAPGTGALLLFVWATAAAAALGWLRHRPSGWGAVLGVSGVSGAAALYVVAVHGAAALLAPSLTGGTTPADATVLVAAAALAFLIGDRVLRSPARNANAGPSRLRSLVYTLALGFGTTPVRAGRARAGRPAGPSTASPCRAEHAHDRDPRHHGAGPDGVAH